MIKRETIETVIAEMIHQQGHELTGLDRLLIRTKTATVLTAKQRYHQRMSSPDFTWRKPERFRR